MPCSKRWQGNQIYFQSDQPSDHSNTLQSMSSHLAELPVGRFRLVIEIRFKQMRNSLLCCQTWDIFGSPRILDFVTIPWIQRIHQMSFGKNSMRSMYSPLYNFLRVLECCRTTFCKFRSEVGFFTNTQSWQYCHYWQLCISIFFQFPSLCALYDMSKCEIRC